jgi:3-methyladenine DNA glycosylase AlkC
VYYCRKRTENVIKIYKNNEKMYKKILDKEQLLYRNKISKYISEIQNKNPKEYWKIINRHYKNKSQEYGYTV